MTWFSTLGGMIDARGRGSEFVWRCHGDCGKFRPIDLDEYLARCGSSYSMHNEITVCPCGAPRTVMKRSGSGSPFTPMKDEWLFCFRELDYGRDPEAWFEIAFME